MGSTNKTAHYELPQFVANDKPSWLGDVNEAMEAIDTGIYGAKSSADGAQQTANNAVAGVQSAGTRMDGIQTQLDTVATQANQTATTVAGHTSAIATNSANINTLNSRMGSTDIAGIGDGTVTGAISSLAGGTGGGGLTKKAESSATGTYAQKLTELQTAFGALTDAEKLRSVVTKGGSVVAQICRIAGTYTSLSLGVNANPIYVQFDIANSTAKEIRNAQYTDISSTSDSDKLELWA